VPHEKNRSQDQELVQEITETRDRCQHHIRTSTENPSPGWNTK
jgi:hypothetical protein